MAYTHYSIYGIYAVAHKKAERWPCGVCGRGVANNSIQCTICQKWVQKKRSGINRSMFKVIRLLFVEVA